MLMAIRRKIAVALRSWQAGGFPSNLVTASPSKQAALDIFKGEWASKIPIDGLEAGCAPLFDDERLRKFLDREGVGGLDTLELGPLEAGHSYMLEKAGAGSILAIEANTRAYLKCLVVKELLGLEKVRFLLGDIFGFMEEDSRQYDLALAYGIMYHLRDPQKMFQLLSKRVKKGGRVLLWTHYWTETVEAECPTLKGHFTSTRSVRLPGGAEVQLHRHEYGSSIFNKGFFGGNAADSEWMTRQGILEVAKECGFEVEIDEDLNHHNGPSILASFRRI